jgi:uncharacterized membrane protein YbhN (UPF0104 family)
VLTLKLLWLCALLAHLFVLTASLPGLTLRRAGLLSLTGGAIANVLPLGGAAGIAVNYAMARSWGHSRGSFVLFKTVTHLWSALARLTLPLIALGVVLLSGRLTSSVAAPAAAGLAVLLLLGAGVALIVWRESAAVTGLGLLERAVRRGTGLLRPGWRPELLQPALKLRREGIAMTRRGWRQQAAGTVSQAAVNVTILWVSLHAVGSGATPVQVLAVFALSQLLTLITVTPGGLGVVELGMTALLAAWGERSATAAAGVLLFRAFTVGLGVPAGAVLFLGWSGLRRRRRPCPAAGTGTVQVAGLVTWHPVVV